jgi:hypothetical protein
MTITAKWKINTDYLNTYWNDWVRYKSEGRMFVVPVGLILAMIGIILSFIVNLDISNIKLCSNVLIFFGFSIVLWHYWEKKRWLNRMRQDSEHDAEQVIVFDEDGIKTKNPISSGEAQWKVVKEIVSAKNGMFLVLRKGISIYIPKKSILNGNTMKEIIKLYDESDT